MTIKLSDKEFKNLIREIVDEEFNLSDRNQDFNITHSYSGVEITTFEVEEEEDDAPEE